MTDKWVYQKAIDTYDEDNVVVYGGTDMIAYENYNPQDFDEPLKEQTSVEVSMAELCRMYAVAYHAGHHDTVEGQYTDVFPADMDTYHKETVIDFLDEL